MGKTGWGDEVMDTVLPWIIAVLISYLLGSLNSALIIGKLYGKDIRQHGSGNAGLTNAFRVLGKQRRLLPPLEIY